MAEGVLGLGAGQAASLNNELIDKLKAAERKAKVEPIETSITDWETEKEVMTAINEKVASFLEAVKPLDLFTSSGSNAFTQISANSTGDSVVFDADDLNALREGTTNITVNALAQKDVYQSATFTSKSDPISGADNDEQLTINHGGTDYHFATSGKTYEELAEAINENENFEAHIEQVGSSEFRIIIKSKDLGTDNTLSISQAGNNLGLETASNHVQTASNLDADIDGVNFSLSTNKIELSNGLSITAMKVDEAGSSSSVTIANNNADLESVLTNFTTKYNELVAAVDTELFGTDSKVEDKAALRNMMDNIKSKLFESYGATSDGNGGYLNDKSIFNYGFELSTDGSLTVNSSDLNKAITDDLEGLKDLFIGTADTEARGLGTQLKEYIDFGINSSDGGILSTYDTALDTRKLALEEDKEKAIESLDERYVQLSAQYAAYGVIINQFESSFSGLKLMIEQSSA